MSVPPPILSSAPSPIRLSAFSDAWRLYLRGIGPYSLTAVLPAILFMLGNWQATSLAKQFIRSEGDLSAISSGDIGLIVTLNLAGLAATYFAGAPFADAVRRQIRGEDIDLRDVFGYRGSALSALIVSMLMSVGVTVGYCCCYVPGILAEGATLGPHFATVDRKQSPLGAFRLSMRLVRGDVFISGASVHVLLSILLVGAIVPVMGYLVGIPLYNIARTLFYVRLLEASEGS